MKGRFPQSVVIELHVNVGGMRLCEFCVVVIRDTVRVKGSLRGSTGMDKLIVSVVESFILPTPSSLASSYSDMI